MKKVEIVELSVESLSLPEDVSIKNYFKEILLKLWEDPALFSGEKPFGSKNWQNDIYETLVRAGVIKGKLDEDGFLLQVSDPKQAKKEVAKLINYIFREKYTKKKNGEKSEDKNEQ